MPEYLTVRRSSAPRRRKALALCLGIAAGVLAWALPPRDASAAPTSIFDDDFVGSENTPRPPRKKDPEPDVPPAQPTPPTEPQPVPVRPAPPVTPPKPATPKPPEPPPAPPVAKRLPMPTAEQQAAADKTIREVFAAQINDKSRPGRRHVADLFITKAAQETDDPGMRFMLLAYARDWAADAGDIRLSIRAVDAIDEAFEVNGPKMRVDAFLRAKTRFSDKVDHAAAVSEGLQLLDDLTRVAQYKQLAVIAPVVRSSAIKGDNKSLATSVRQITADAEALAAEFDKAKLSADLLKATPTDPAANLSVGRFLCLFRDDWRGGLPLLLKAAEGEPLRALAVLETSGVKDPAKRKELAEGWWVYSENNKNNVLIRRKSQSRSCAWYGTIFPSLTGLEKVVAQKRLSEARANGADVDVRPAGFETTGAASSVSASPAR